MIYKWGRTCQRERGRFDQWREAQTNETEKQEGKQSKLVDTEEKQQETCSAQYPFLNTGCRKSHFKRPAKNWGPDKSDKDALTTRSKWWREGGKQGGREEIERQKIKGIKHKLILKKTGVFVFVFSIFIPKHIHLMSPSGEQDTLGY